MPVISFVISVNSEPILITSFDISLPFLYPFMLYAKHSLLKMLVANRSKRVIRRIEFASLDLEKKELESRFVEFRENLRKGKSRN